MCINERVMTIKLQHLLCLWWKIISLSLREAQQMNVIFWRTWSRTTTTPTDPGSIPTGTWLWREQASINRVRRPAWARRPSCFCPCQPSADGEMLSTTDHRHHHHELIRSRNASQTHALGEHRWVYVCVFRYQQDPKSHRYALRSNFPKHSILPLYTLEHEEKTSLIRTKPARILAGMLFLVRLQNVSLL